MALYQMWSQRETHTSESSDTLSVPAHCLRRLQIDASKGTARQGQNNSDWQRRFHKINFNVILALLAKERFLGGTFPAHHDVNIGPIRPALVLVVQTPILEKESD